MKHSVKITIILLGMFLITQLIGLAVIDSYAPKTIVVYNETTGLYENQTTRIDLPMGFQPPEISPYETLISLAVAIIIAVVLIFLLMKIKAEFFMKLWFFLVVVIALTLTINAFTIRLGVSPYFLLILTIPVAFFKIYRKTVLLHNATELLIYPGIAAVFVPILNIPAAIIFLILLSVYDIYAVWHAGFMQKMAKYQINQLGVFSGFFIPYLGKKEKSRLNY